MKRYLLFLCLTLITLNGCALPTNVHYSRLMPAEMEIKGINKLAVADFDGQERSGRLIASKVAVGIVDSGHYRLFEREKLNEILAEHDLYKMGEGIDRSTTQQLKLNGVDALIFGVVDAYSIDDYEGTAKEEKKVATGRYRKVEYKDKDSGETKYKEEEIIKTVLWDRPYIQRQGTVGVTFRMINISTGEVMAVEAMTENYSERAWVDEMHKKLPSKDAILDDLASEVVERFLAKIQPHWVSDQVAFESTGAGHSKLGISYAENGLWDKALAEFEAAAQSEKEQKESSTYYNLSMIHFILGDFQKAEDYIEQAIAMNPKQMYIKALARIRSES